MSSVVAAKPSSNDGKEYARRLEELYAAEGDEVMKAKVAKFMERYASCPALFYRLVKDKFERMAASGGGRGVVARPTSATEPAYGDPMDMLMTDAADEEQEAVFTEDFQGDPSLLEKEKTDATKPATTRQPAKRKRGTLPPLDAAEYHVFKRYFNGLRSEEGHMYTLPTSGTPAKCVSCKSEGHSAERCPMRRCLKCGEMGHEADKCQDKAADEQMESVVEEAVAIVLGKGTNTVSKDEAAFVLDSLRCTTCGGRGHGLYCKAKSFGLWQKPSKSMVLGGIEKTASQHQRHSSESRAKKGEEEEEAPAKRDRRSRSRGRESREKRKRTRSRSRSRRSRTHESRKAKPRESTEKHHARSSEGRSERGKTSSKEDKAAMPKPGGSFFANLPPLKEDRQPRRSYLRRGAETKTSGGDSRWAGVGTDVAAETSSRRGEDQKWEYDTYGRGYHRDYQTKSSGATAGKDEFGRALTLRSREESQRAADSYIRPREEPPAAGGRKRGIAFGPGGGRSERDYYGGSSRRAWEGSAFEQDDLTSWTRRGDEATRVIDDEASNLNARLIEVDITDLDGRRKVVLLTPGSTMADLVEWYAARAPDASKVRVIDVNSGVDYGNREVTVKRLADNQLGRGTVRVRLETYSGRY
ncbi:hypothetical protein FOZ60_000184 [Perkinsus olseni]|uniref:CCHC-type domain-containing protein n=2 Tax=Perkinsus olseni TaxID=32597 RepID=A0A7J6PL54_PEROL|nr:hypothetical protein FOZ60_000184 [Perkinsus olseni]